MFEKLYFGRGVSVTDKFVVKFLHEVGTQTFDWPMRNDQDTVLKRRVFYGPVELSGTGPFHIPSLAEITKLFKHLRKQPHVSNFVIDNYPEIMRNIYSKDDLNIKTITCERFERAIGIVATRKIWKEGDSLWQQDIIFVPCNSE